MAYLKLDLDNETYSRLVSLALQERRPIPWQAEVMLRRALDLPFPVADDAPPGAAIRTQVEAREGVE